MDAVPDERSGCNVGICDNEEACSVLSVGAQYGNRRLRNSYLVISVRYFLGASLL